MTHTCRAEIAADGLQDGCGRCAELAADPLNLDDDMLRDLVRRTLTNRFGAWHNGEGDVPSVFGAARDGEPRSDTEAVAMANTMTLLERVGRLYRAAGPSVVLYLVERWRIATSIKETP